MLALLTTILIAFVVLIALIIGGGLITIGALLGIIVKCCAPVIGAYIGVKLIFRLWEELGGH